MKKIMLSVILATFAVAVQAGENKASCADKDGGCCAKTTTATSTKAQCSMAKEQTKASCPAMAKSAGKLTHTRQALLSPKAASNAG